MALCVGAILGSFGQSCRWSLAAAAPISTAEVVLRVLEARLPLEVLLPSEVLVQLLAVTNPVVAYQQRGEVGCLTTREASWLLAVIVLGLLVAARTRGNGNTSFLRYQATFEYIRERGLFTGPYAARVTRHQRENSKRRSFQPQ